MVTELAPLEALEPFGWAFTPGPLPPGAISHDAAIAAALGRSREQQVAARPGAYTERGRYRVEAGGKRITLYSDRPVWVVSIEPEPDSAEAQGTEVERYARHVVIDARTGQLLTAFLAVPEPGAENLLDLHEPLDAPELSSEEAIRRAMAGEEDHLAGLPVDAEYGSRRRLVPGFLQVTDVWRVTFDTSGLPPAGRGTPPEVAWVVVVDDKAGHRWFSAAVTKGEEG